MNMNIKYVYVYCTHIELGIYNKNIIIDMIYFHRNKEIK